MPSWKAAIIALFYMAIPIAGIVVLNLYPLHVMAVLGILCFLMAWYGITDHIITKHKAKQQVKLAKHFKK
jgi:hypothetical protein